MQQLVIEEPYRFIPPVRGRRWVRFFTPILPHFLRASYGVTEVDLRHAERLTDSVAAGRGVLLTPNHPRLTDPMVMGTVVTRTGVPTFTMASFHLFKQAGFWGRAEAWMMRRLGAFSLFREGTDRTSLNYAIDALTDAARPVVVFPEGTCSGANDRLTPLLDGVSLVARTAAKRRVKRRDGGGPPVGGDPAVVVHPVAIKYEFLDDPAAALDPVLTDLERRFGWENRSDVPPLVRTEAFANAFLAGRECEFTGGPRCGDPSVRSDELIEAILRPLEDRRAAGDHGGSVVGRVKTLRAAILAALQDPATPDADKPPLRDELRRCYVAQQLHFLYPEDYLTDDSPVERLLETVIRFDEELNTHARTLGRWRVLVEIGEAIPVGTERVRGEDPLMEEIAARLTAMLAGLSAEVAGRRPTTAGELAAVPR